MKKVTFRSLKTLNSALLLNFMKPEFTSTSTIYINTLVLKAALTKLPAVWLFVNVSLMPLTDAGPSLRRACVSLFASRGEGACVGSCSCTGLAELRGVRPALSPEDPHLNLFNRPAA